MKRILSRWWNAEWPSRNLPVRKLWLPALIVIFAYPLGELLFFPPNPEFITLGEMQDASNRGEAASGLWLGWVLAVGFVIGFRTFFLLYGYFIGGSEAVREKFFQRFVIYTPAVILGILLKVAIMAGIALVLWLQGWTFGEGMEALSRAGEWLALQLNARIPTLVELPGTLWPLLAAWTLYGFTGWFLHWLTHTFRFLWHVVHAPHHAPDFLHPVASPVAYTFDIFLLLPSVIVHAALTKLFHSEPLLVESALLIMAMYLFEVFNHSTVHYDLAHRNPIIRICSSLFGGMGVYHYVHHSSAAAHQKANLGGGLFLLWDRVFGTYVKPPKEKPAIGLTHDVPVHRNPFRIAFGGAAKIISELWLNKGLLTKMKILFGSIHYEPPISREFLKIQSDK